MTGMAANERAFSPRQDKKGDGTAYLIAAGLFIIALLPRLPGLDRFLTSDENTNIFFAGSNVIAAFLAGDFRATYWHFYPGVTMSWLDGLGMAGQYAFDILAGKPLPPFTEYIYGPILTLLVANRLPYAILTAAAAALIYLLARRLVAGQVALLGALFIAFDPFFLAHSRVAHGDAPVAVFMALSALSFFLYVSYISGKAAPQTAGTIGKDSSRTERNADDNIFTMPPHHIFFRPLTNRYLLLSAVSGSLAALTKAPGQFMALFIAGLSLLYALLEIRAEKTRRAQSPSPPVWPVIARWLAVVVVWGLVALAVFILLWPAMWVDPVGTFRQMWTETFGKVNEGHLVYFLGQPTLDPGPWFYLYVIPFRLTPVALIGALLSLGLLLPRLSSHPAVRPLSNPGGYTLLRSPHFLLWGFTITLLLFGNLSPKKQDRYLLPLFPVLDLLAAAGWLGLISLINYQLGMGNLWLSGLAQRRIDVRTRRLLARSLFSTLLIAALLLLQFGPVIGYYPYYLTYFNPLLGGPVRAARTTLMGWGEGMEQVAAYLNARPGAQELYVASTPSQTLLPYFAGTGENFYTNDVALRADYVVLYLAQMQRLAPSPEIVSYFESREPEETITIHDVVYAKIYPGPKLILNEMPPGTTPLNIGLDDIIRLAGYERRYSPETGSLTLTLYWHALAPSPTDYTISVRARSAGGELLLQQDRWPANGLLPTGQWRQGDYVVDAHTLDLSPAEAARVSAFEIVVYDAKTGQTLGPPVTINNE